MNGHKDRDNSHKHAYFWLNIRIYLLSEPSVYWKQRTNAPEQVNDPRREAPGLVMSKPVVVQPPFLTTTAVG